MSITWTDEEKTLLESVRPVLSTREIHKLFRILKYDRSVEAIQKMSRKLGVVFKDFGQPATHGLTKEEKIALKKVLSKREEFVAATEIPQVVSPAEQAVRTKKRREAMVDILDKLREIRKNTPRIGSISTKKSTAKDKESLVLLLSDWHVCQRVMDTEHQEVVYDKEIALDRIRSTPQIIRDMFTDDEFEKFDEVVVLLGGDMISGEGIFPGHEMSIHDTAVEQATMVAQAIWAMLKEFRELFPLTRVITTKGNHGRTGQSPESNWDNMIYQILGLLIDEDGGNDITIKNRYGDYAIADVRGWKGLLRHKSPAQADTSAGIAKFAGWHGIHEWDFFGFGHFHHWGVMTWNGKPIFRNGSLMGGDEYAETLAKYDHPVQLCWGVSNDNVCTFVKPINYK